jgi:hypothetical protein
MPFRLNSIEFDKTEVIANIHKLHPCIIIEITEMTKHQRTLTGRWM